MTELSLFRGDPFDRLLHRLRLARDGRPRFGLLVPLIIGIGWVVPLLFTYFEGHLFSSHGRRGFLMDFNLPIQTMAVIALLVAQAFVDEHVRGAGVLFASAGLVRDTTDYDHAAKSLTRLRTSPWPDAVCLLLSALFVYLWATADLDRGIASWQTNTAGNHSSSTAAQWWLILVFGPVLEFLWVRWAWKITLWVLFLYRMSRSRLRIASAHPDRAGGLGFVGEVQASFGTLIFAVGLLVLADALKQIVVEGSPSRNVGVEIAAFSILGPAAFLVPLLLFTRQLYVAKRRDVIRYGDAVTRSLNASMQVGGKADSAASLAEEEKRYKEAVRMRVVPFDMVSLLHLFGAAVAPMLPLIVRGLDLPKWLQEVVTHGR